MPDSTLPIASDRPVDLRPQLAAAAREFYQRGWMVGTAGNLSARLPDGSFWITASGQAKGALSADEFLRIAADGTVLEQPAPHLKPSAETAIHQVIYELLPSAQVCYHVHSVESNLVSRFVKGDTLLLPPLEMLKGLGVWDENPHCELTVFTNHAQVSRIAAEIGDRFRLAAPQVPALLIRDHGITVWASSLQTAHHYLELLEYIFRYMVAARQVGIR